MRIDKVGGTFYIHPKRPVKGIANIERLARRCGFYGPEWKLDKAISKKIVFRCGCEKSTVTYEIKD